MFELDKASILNGPSEKVCEELFLNGAKMIATFELKNGDKKKVFVPIRVNRKEHTTYYFNGRVGNFNIKGECSPRLCGIKNAGKIVVL